MVVIKQIKYFAKLKRVPGERADRPGRLATHARVKNCTIGSGTPGSSAVPDKFPQSVGANHIKRKFGTVSDLLRAFGFNFVGPVKMVYFTPDPSNPVDLGEGPF